MAARNTVTGDKGLGLWMSTSLVVGNMIGSGVFLLPASLAVYGGISIFGWLFTSTGALLLALVFARLSRLVPKGGGPYAYTRQGFGDFAGFLVGWGYWISIVCGNAAIAVAFVGYLGFFWPFVANTAVPAAIATLVALWVLTAVNTLGVRQAGFVQLITTILKLLPLVLIAVFGLFYLNLDYFTPLNVSGKSTFSAITATGTLTLWAFLGLESATVPAENVENPRRTIPRATVLGTLVAALVYILGTAAVMGIMPATSLASSTAPFAEAARRIWGSGAAFFVATGAAISSFGALNGWILLQGQVPLATARDGLFPASFGKTSKNGTPVTGLLISSVLATVLVIMNYAKGLVELFTFIILLATMTALLPYIFSTMAEWMIFLKERRRFNRQKAFRSTLTSALAFLYSLWAIAGSGQETVYWGFLLLMAGVPVYVWIKGRSDD